MQRAVSCSPSSPSRRVPLAARSCSPGPGSWAASASSRSRTAACSLRPSSACCSPRESAACVCRRGSRRAHGAARAGGARATISTPPAWPAVRSPSLDLPAARLPGVEEDVRLLSAHRGNLVAERTRLCQRLRWHLVALLLSPLKVPPRRLSAACWLTRLEAELADLAGMRARIVRELTARCRELNREIARFRARTRPPDGCSGPGAAGPARLRLLSAATLLGETAGAMRFASDARFAMFTGTAPLPASSGRVVRHRLNRSGNRRLNAALHRIAITQLQKPGPARSYVERRMAEGKSWREAMRCLKRHLARVVWRELCRDEERRSSRQPRNDRAGGVDIGAVYVRAYVAKAHIGRGWRRPGAQPARCGGSAV